MGAAMCSECGTKARDHSRGCAEYEPRSECEANRELREPLPPAPALGAGQGSKVKQRGLGAGSTPLSPLPEMPDNASPSSALVPPPPGDAEDGTPIQSPPLKEMEATAQQFEELVISVDRSTGEGLGIDTFPVNDTTLLIKDITEDGLVDHWNRRNADNPKLIVRSDMVITKVNGVQGRAVDLIDECRKKEMLYITLVPGSGEVAGFRILLDKSNGDQLGIDIDHEDHVTLEIVAITGGLMEKWNRDNPDQAVQDKDRIVEINGISGSADVLVEECKKLVRLDMLIHRYS